MKSVHILITTIALSLSPKALSWVIICSEAREIDHLAPEIVVISGQYGPNESHSIAEYTSRQAGQGVITETFEYDSYTPNFAADSWPIGSYLGTGFKDSPLDSGDLNITHTETNNHHTHTGTFTRTRSAVVEEVPVYCRAFPDRD
jgi:hypothetical protein